jgi:(2Fe-2S) ferredoxin
MNPTHLVWSQKNAHSLLHCARLSNLGPHTNCLTPCGDVPLVIVYHIIRNGTTYTDLGVDHFDKRNQAQTERRLIKRLEQLGYTITLESRAAA